MGINFGVSPSDYQVERHRLKTLIKDQMMQMRVNKYILISQEGGPQCRKKPKQG